ncbi:MAG: UDP-N-acetylmuramoyl-L-alanyl-D-glutamate--2,6-diaminopimelate ligase [Planctomycetota bacterium]
MQLETLFDNLPIKLPKSASAVEVTGLTDDSRAVQPGDLFVARPGVDGDAMRFVPSAIDAGAAAVLLPFGQDDALPEGVAIAHTKKKTEVDQRLCGQLAERYYDEPSKKLKLVGVTGTNGKTTTVTITRHLLQATGNKTGLIGTVELDTGSPDGPRPAMLTTPGAIELTKLLAEMVANGCTHGVMEVSSHALDQGRADHLRFAAAAFTNLTQDHLDYHGSMPAYADAKAILFEKLDKQAFAIINGDDPFAPRMARGCCATVAFSAVLDHSEEESPESLKIKRCCVFPFEMSAASSRAEFIGPFARIEATLPMPGVHNLSNAIQALALARLVSDATPQQLRDALEACPPVPGRLEPVGPDWPEPPSSDSQLPTVLVDYAHTPDALINVGKSLRELTKGKLITVFGCGGDRDRTKRPLMAKAAQQHADVVVLTSDNPRTEDPKQILDDAEAGFDASSNNETHTLADRVEAIRFAIDMATESDTVLIAGKGHEDYQILGTQKVHFDDREQAAAALKAKRG